MPEQFSDLIYPRRDRVRRNRNVTRTSYFPLEGGLDVVTPAISIRPGFALGMLNFEPWYQGGYRRIPGYERYDGRPKPSDAVFEGFEVSDASGLSLGGTVTGDASSTTGIVCGIWDDDGTYGSDWIGVTKISGSGFTNGEGVNTAAFTIDSESIQGEAPDVTLEKLWQWQAEDEYRDDIAVVPGSGPVRGAWQLLGESYAIRDNAGATAGIIHKASATGWVTTGVTMAEYIKFNTGLAAGATVAEGDTLTGGVSGATGTIHRIVLNGGSGAWDSSGEGYFVLTGVAGGPFQNGEDLESPALTDIATADGVNTTFALSDGGFYRFKNHNFFGGAATYRAYACNGVGDGFEIDENGVVSPILMPTTAANGGTKQTGTPPTNNTPFLIEEHRNHLFFAFEGGSVQHSVVGEPLNFSGFLGAAEFGLGDDVTSMNSVVGNVITISTKRETRGLFGTGLDDWNMKLVAEQSGSVLNGSQKIDTVYSLDDLGITSVARSDQFGDFVNATVSQKVQPIVIEKRPSFTDSVIVRESNQIRFYFNDGSFLIMYVPAGSQAESRQYQRTGNIAQFGSAEYPIPVLGIWNSDDDTGKERTFFATDDATDEGFVFEDQIGRSFDGANIQSLVRTAFNHIKSPTGLKYFRRADLELNATKQLDIRFSSNLSYGSQDPTVFDTTVFGVGGFWDEDNWNEFLYDGQTISSARAELAGTGENIGFTLVNDSPYEDPWVMQGLTLYYDMRRIKR